MFDRNISREDREDARLDDRNSYGCEVLHPTMRVRCAQFSVHTAYLPSPAYRVEATEAYSRKAQCYGNYGPRRSDRGPFSDSSNDSRAVCGMAW